MSEKHNEWIPGWIHAKSVPQFSLTGISKIDSGVKKLRSIDRSNRAEIDCTTSAKHASISERRNKRTSWRIDAKPIPQFSPIRIPKIGSGVENRRSMHQIERESNVQHQPNMLDQKSVIMSLGKWSANPIIYSARNLCTSEFSNQWRSCPWPSIEKLIDQSVEWLRSSDRTLHNYQLVSFQRFFSSTSVTMTQGN